MASKELQAAIDAAWEGLTDKSLQWDERRHHLATMMELHGEHDDATLPTGYPYNATMFATQLANFAQSWPYGTGTLTEADAEAAPHRGRDPPACRRARGAGALRRAHRQRRGRHLLVVATRLRKAIEELKAAAKGRSFVLLLDPTENDHSYSFELHIPPHIPHYVTLGLLRQGQMATERIMAETETSAKMGSGPVPEPKLADMGHGPVEWERDDARIADTIAVIVTSIRPNMALVRAAVIAWTDEEARYAEEWAARELAYRQGDGDVQRWTRPKFFPSDWR